MPDDTEPKASKLVRGSRSAPQAGRGSTSPRYRGSAGGSLKPAVPSLLRTSGMAPRPLAERPECQPAQSNFRPHPSAPLSTQPQYNGMAPTVQAPAPDVEEPAPVPATAPPVKVKPPPSPMQPQPVQPVTAAARARSPYQHNAPKYQKPPNDTTPQYVNPPPRPAAAQVATPPPTGAALTVEQLREAAATGDVSATRLLASLGTDEV